MSYSVAVGASWKRKTSPTAAIPPRQLQQYNGQWNVQVVRGKVTTRCLWNACKALSLGLLLLMIGTTMAVVGYYADQLSETLESRGNSTVRIRNERRGFHLNNLSYAGPIVMGVGGFIVVAACVMTFEARDSAAKVVPARFKPSNNQSIVVNSSNKSTPYSNKSITRVESKKNTGSQTPGSKVPNMYKMANLGHGNLSPCNDVAIRRDLTAAFVQFSRNLMEANNNQGIFLDGTIKKSPSAPNLVQLGRSPTRKRKSSKSSPRSRRQKGSVHRRSGAGGCSLLSPRLLERQALSMDNPFYDGFNTPPTPYLSRQHSGRSGSSEMELGASAGVNGSQTSMAMDLHFQNECPVTVKIRDQTKRSDTTRKNQLMRQKPVEDSNRFRAVSPRLVAQNTVDETVFRVKKPSTTGPRHQSMKHYTDEQRTTRTSERQHCGTFSRSSTEESKENKKTNSVKSKEKKRKEKKVGLDRKYSMQQKLNLNKSNDELTKTQMFEIRRQNSQGCVGSECIIHQESPERIHKTQSTSVRRSQSKSPTRQGKTARRASTSPTRNTSVSSPTKNVAGESCQEGSSSVESQTPTVVEVQIEVKEQ